jgi:hypothetical protein
VRLREFDNFRTMDLRFRHPIHQMERGEASV